MKYTAKHRFADVGPRKIRPFAQLIRGKNVDEALQLLRFYPNRGAKLLLAVVQSAYGNADDQENPDPDGLVVSECRVDGAPMFKRIQPRARGTAFSIKRRMSHIVVALSDPEDLLRPGGGDEGEEKVPGPSGEIPPVVGGETTPVLTTPATVPAPQ
ncbi:MAG: 50S ribosomal protein L22 [Isosphaera sp.]|nr:50S ribosomal protein L22 [Isosphaera sp.]